jgi:hypothetical protein
MKRETLDEEVRRTKARWLRRVMYDERPTSTAKCLAFLIADHLNCVTLDAWPALSTISTLLGAKSTKTAQRAARNLQALGYITIKPRGECGAGYRYAPTFSSEDMDSSVAKSRQACPSSADTAVTESSSDIRLKSSPTPSSASAHANAAPSGLRYHPAQRGKIETYIAQLLGKDGIELLTCLAAIDDAIVERLCRTYVENSLTRRELAAARLAAEHYRSASLQSRSRARRDAISALRPDALRGRTR